MAANTSSERKPQLFPRSVRCNSGLRRLAKAKKKVSDPKKKSDASDSIPQRNTDIKITGSENHKGKLAHSYPTTTSKGQKLSTPFAGGGMVSFRFKKKSYLANEKDAVRLLNYYKRYLSTYQVVKAWFVKGQIKNTLSNGGVYKNRTKTQGWAGKSKVVGYSTGKGPNAINARMLNFLVRETQASVKAAVSGSKGEYGQNLAIIYKPASFSVRGSRMEFEVNIFFDAKGLAYFKRQTQLV